MKIVPMFQIQRIQYNKNITLFTNLLKTRKRLTIVVKIH